MRNTQIAIRRAVLISAALNCVVNFGWALTGPEILSRTADSTVMILTGQGAGRLSGVASGVIVRADGVILTAYHVVRDAREVQIQLKNGEVFDRAELLGFDERRDVAALKIAGHDLPVLPLGAVETVEFGEPAYAVTNSNGLSWSGTEGIFSASRPAEEVKGAGSGYRVLQFTAPVAPGASGGPLVDRQGALVGIIIRGIVQGPSFAVPIANVIGLADGNQHAALGSGAALRLPQQSAPPSSSVLQNANPQDILRMAKTAQVRSQTSFFIPDSLDRELSKIKEFAGLGILIVKDARLADLVIEIDRPLFTYQFTFSISDPKTSIVLSSGKVTAIDGEVASRLIAKQVAKLFVNARQAAQTTPSTGKI